VLLIAECGSVGNSAKIKECASVAREVWGISRFRLCDISPQPLGKNIEYRFTGLAVAKILMHYQPGIEMKGKEIRQQSL
jgi:hypothetical protein